MDPKPCLWTEYPDSHYWETACGGAYCFEYDFRREARQSYQFCPRCGSPLQIAPIHKRAEAPIHTHKRA